MKKLLVLVVIFASLAAFVYFYEIVGGKKREETKKLEESLFKLKSDQVVSIELQGGDKPVISLKKEGDNWVLTQPVEAQADSGTVQSLLSNIQDARIERTLEEKPGESQSFGLKQPRMVITVGTKDGKKEVLQVGSKDYSGSNMYVKVASRKPVYLTSNYLFTLADKGVNDWRNKKVLAFDQEKVNQIEIVRPGGTIELRKQGKNWMLESPLQEQSDQSTVSGLLSALSFAQAQKFVEEKPEKLKSYGLVKPALQVRLKEAGEENWKTLQVGDRKDETYFARNLDRTTVFTLKKDLVEKLEQKLWAFRDKDVVDVSEDQVTEVAVKRGEEEIRIKHQDEKWTVEKPEQDKGKEVLSYKFWYPIDDMEFASIKDASDKKAETALEKPLIDLSIKLKDGSSREFRFARQGTDYLAQQVQSGRLGTIKKEDFEKLNFKLKDVLS